MKVTVILASGDNPVLLKILEQMNNSAYKSWVKRDSPRGNAGVIIRGIGDKFSIEPYRQVG